MTGLWLAAAVGITALVSRAAARCRRPVRRCVAGALCGVGALGAVNLLAPFTGVSVAVNGLSAFTSVVLGAPGVAGLLVLQRLFAP
ncbi:MAG TPA: pro-sigmaK processing inhibitor BofA family protein [Candidatus Gemmiger avium]|nr:pro-sigmaK processing inhibitor BofA family protein [Candidatus Gemmiger avium]